MMMMMIKMTTNEPNPSNGIQSRPSKLLPLPQKTAMPHIFRQWRSPWKPKNESTIQGGNQVKVTYSKITSNMGKNGVSSLQYGFKTKNTPLICKEDPKRKRHDHQVFLNFLLFKSASTWDFVFSILQTCHSQIEAVYSWGTWLKKQSLKNQLKEIVLLSLKVGISQRPTTLTPAHISPSHVCFCPFFVPGARYPLSEWVKRWCSVLTGAGGTRHVTALCADIDGFFEGVY